MAEKTTIVFLFFSIIICHLSTANVDYERQYVSAEFFKDKLDLELDVSCTLDKIRVDDYRDLQANLSTCEYDLMVPLEIISRIEAVDEYVKGFCGNPNAQLCATISRKTLDPCLSDVQRQYLIYKADYYLGTKIYACKMNGKPLKDAVSHGGEQCPREVFDEQQNCLSSLLEIKRDNLEDRYSKENCRKAIESVECVDNVVEKFCKGNEMHKFLSQSSIAGLKTTPCKAYFDNAAITKVKEVVDQKLAIELDVNCVQQKLSKANYEEIWNYLHVCENNISENVYTMKKMDDIDEYVKDFCENKMAKKCADLVMENFKVCLSKGQRDYLRHSSAFYTGIKNYLCEMDGKPLKVIHGVSMRHCPSGISAELRKCMFNESEFTNEKWDKKFSEENCRRIKEYAECEANVHELCKNDDISNITLQSYYAALKATPCKILFEELTTKSISTTSTPTTLKQSSSSFKSSLSSTLLATIFLIAFV